LRHVATVSLTPVAGLICAVLRLRSNDDGTITITVASADENDRLAVDDASLALTLWNDDAHVVRGRFEHAGSHAVAYVQGTRTALGELADRIGLVGPRPL
jgi:hypothetical protein